MRFPFVMHIAYKELLSTLRDRRAIVSNLLIPLLLLPVIMLGMPLVLGGLFQREGETVTTIAVSGMTHLPPELINVIEMQNAELVEVADPMAAVRDDEYPAGFSVEPGFAEELEAGNRAPLALYSKPNNMRSDLNANRITNAVRMYQQQLVSERLAEVGLDAGVLEPIVVTPVDASTEAERAGGMLVWLIPFFLAIWVLSGGQMVAIDATAGEKERGTLEVLLVAPIRRLEVVVGKALATLTMGLAAGVMAVAGYFAGSLVMRAFIGADGAMAEVGEMMLGTLNVDALTLGLLVASAFLLSALLANLLMGITMFAKSFKEAQSYVAPLSFLIIVPILALQFSDFFAFNAFIYLIPVVNVLLSMDAIIKGTVLPLHLALTWGSTILYALLLLAFAYRSFKREDVLFKT